MRIAVDCRLIGQSGIGTFIENVVDAMIPTPRLEFLLIGNEQRLATYAQRPDCRIVSCTHGSFTPQELLRFPVSEVNRCDAFFTPNFNIPMGIRVPIFATIHDIVFFDTDNFGSSVHRAALRWYIRRALRISSGLFTVSRFSRQRIQQYFNTQRKLTVVGNGLSSELLAYKATHPAPTATDRKGIVYLGNIKPYKGLHTLWQAYQRLIADDTDEPLTVIGNFDFRTKDREILQTMEANSDRVTLVTGATNQQVYHLLSHARCLVSPSLYEGFGIPPLEAMSLGTPVILSDIAVYKEVYSQFPVTFFRAADADDLYLKLCQLPQAPIDVDSQIEATYTYRKTAQQILENILMAIRHPS